jgi:hypothetical protein
MHPITPGVGGFSGFKRIRQRRLFRYYFLSFFLSFFPWPPLGGGGGGVAFTCGGGGGAALTGGGGGGVAFMGGGGAGAAIKGGGVAFTGGGGGGVPFTRGGGGGSRVFGASVAAGGGEGGVFLCTRGVGSAGECGIFGAGVDGGMGVPVGTRVFPSPDRSITRLAGSGCCCRRTSAVGFTGSCSDTADAFGFSVCARRTDNSRKWFAAWRCSPTCAVSSVVNFPLPARATWARGVTRAGVMGRLAASELSLWAANVAGGRGCLPSRRATNVARKSEAHAGSPRWRQP